MRPLRILMLMADMPYPPNWGAGARNYHLIAQLARRHDVALLTYRTSDDPAARDELERLCSIVVLEPPAAGTGRAKRIRQIASLFSSSSYHATRLHSAGMQSALDRLLAHNRFDAVQIESSTFSRLRISRGEHVVVLDEHNIEFETHLRAFRTEPSIGRKLYGLAEYFKGRRDEIRAWRMADGCTFTSAREERLMRAIVARKSTAVVPNGVDVTYFRPTEVAPDPDSIVFTGLMSYRPNVDAVTYFARAVLPLIRRARPSVKFTVVGRDPAADVLRLVDRGVEVTGAVPDVRPFVSSAAVVAVPLRFGSGTRLKIAEGLAMGKAIVSTTLGAEGIDVHHGQEILIADRADAFAEQVIRLMRDPALATRLGSNGRTFAEARLTWEAATERLESFYHELLQRRHGHVGPERQFGG